MEGLWNLTCRWVVFMLFLASGCGSSDGSDYTARGLPEANSLGRITNLLQKKEDVFDLAKKPALFDYLSSSRNAVLAKVVKSEPVGLRQKKHPGSFDLEDSVAGGLYTFEVEKEVCRDLRSGPADRDPMIRFQIFVPITVIDEPYKEGRRFILFLEEVNDVEFLIGKYELKKKTYYRLYEGAKSLFHGLRDPFHAAPTKGLLNVESENHQPLIRRIEQFCDALSSESVGGKIRDLKKLVDSDDEEMSENAAYAIRWLKSRKPRS